MVVNKKVHFVSIEDDRQGLVEMRPETTVPIGAAAFWYGVDAARELLKNSHGR
jgi:hypothetical protein